MWLLNREDHMDFSPFSFGHCVVCLKKLKVDDTKGLITSRQWSKKEKGQTLMYKTLHTNTKDRATQSSIKTELNSADPYLEPGVSLLLQTRCYAMNGEWTELLFHMLWMIFWKYYSLIARFKKASYLIIHKLYITLTQSACSSIYFEIANKIVIQWASYCALTPSEQYHLLCIIST
jgi:hypothetical protein